MTYYDYKELRNAAITGTQKDVNRLGRWFERYGILYWNGECYDADEGLTLWPVYGETEDEPMIVRYELR